MRAAIAIAACALADAAGAAAIPLYDHVVIVIMENHSYVQIIGNTTDAPYINALAARGANFTQSFAIEHPSQPNYLDLFSGSNQGVTNDDCPQAFSTANLASEVVAAGLSFSGYSELLPAEGSTACSAGTAPHTYKRKHNPWVNFSNVAAGANQPFTAFPSDFASLPTVSFVIPDQCNDMHDCSVATGDAWLQAHIDGYAQWAQYHNSLLVLTWDENDFSALNQIATVFAGALVIPADYAETINHYRVLATLLSMYGLAPVGSESAMAALPITDVWDTRLFADGFEP
jgi:hypothetical protein